MMNANHCRHCFGRTTTENTETLVGNSAWSRKRPSPGGLVTDLTPGVAVGTGTFSLSVGFKKSKIDNVLMNRREAVVQKDGPLPTF